MPDYSKDIKFIDFNVNKPNQILTFDVEEWYHANYDSYDYNTVRNPVDRLSYLLPNILELLTKHDSKATFFILGEIAQQMPELVRLIDSANMPIASHSFTHRLLYNLSGNELYNELANSKKALENILGKKISGFRAPCFSINNNIIDEYFDILGSLGYSYDSSIVPVKYLSGGFANFPRKPFEYRGIAEVPIGINKKSFMGTPLSGAYFRVFNSKYHFKIIKEHSEANIPLVYYLHPKDLDDQNPSLPLPFYYNIVHKMNTKWAIKKLEKIIKRYKFCSIEEKISNK